MLYEVITGDAGQDLLGPGDRHPFRVSGLDAGQLLAFGDRLACDILTHLNTLPLTHRIYCVYCVYGVS